MKSEKQRRKRQHRNRKRLEVISYMNELKRPQATEAKELEILGRAVLETQPRDFRCVSPLVPPLRRTLKIFSHREDGRITDQDVLN
jgi:primosomal protein N''